MRALLAASRLAARFFSAQQASCITAALAWCSPMTRTTASMPPAAAMRAWLAALLAGEIQQRRMQASCITAALAWCSPMTRTTASMPPAAPMRCHLSIYLLERPRRDTTVDHHHRIHHGLA